MVVLAPHNQQRHGQPRQTLRQRRVMRGGVSLSVRLQQREAGIGGLEVGAAEDVRVVKAEGVTRAAIHKAFRDQGILGRHGG